MTAFTTVFEQHLNQEFPPKFVFCIDDRLEIRSIWITDIPDLDKHYTYVGDSANYPELFAEYGSLPMLCVLD